ncbi:CD209 antigen-like protein E [Drosophila subobscura]|uniref:CD209 antigen-like protein E n=1 Tax=Drosophila subobscura TaxID=7241 RepID=UPI00155AAE21|nr:CD209 antigen-like protein E [Drosophila subobscura]
MRCSIIIFVLFAITFGRTRSQHCDVDESEHKCGGYCYAAVKPALEYLAILQKRVASYEANQPADTASKILLIDEKLKTLEGQTAIQEELLNSKIQKLEQQLASVQETISKLKPKVFEPFKKIDSKYYYIEHENKKTWHGALKKCLEMGAQLASVQNENEMKALRSRLKPHQKYWIDLNDLDKEGEFISATTGVKGTFFHWYKGEPNNFANSEDCVDLTFEYAMSDRSCDQTHYFICELSSVD